MNVNVTAVKLYNKVSSTNQNVGKVYIYRVHTRVLADCICMPCKQECQKAAYVWAIDKTGAKQHMCGLLTRVLVSCTSVEYKQEWQNTINL